MPSCMPHMQLHSNLNKSCIRPQQGFANKSSPMHFVGVWIPFAAQKMRYLYPFLHHFSCSWSLREKSHPPLHKQCWRPFLIAHCMQSWELYLFDQIMLGQVYTEKVKQAYWGASKCIWCLMRAASLNTSRYWICTWVKFSMSLSQSERLLGREVVGAVKRLVVVFIYWKKSDLQFFIHVEIPTLIWSWLTLWESWEAENILLTPFAVSVQLPVQVVCCDFRRHWALESVITRPTSACFANLTTPHKWALVI